VSDFSVPPAVALQTTAASSTDSDARFHARIQAELALARLERSVARLERKLVRDPRDWRTTQQWLRRLADDGRPTR
jgi:hypothetical protein